jgi:hypothetical protein
MEKHASLKTQVKLLMKEKEGLERAFEVEQAGSVELENSLRVGCSTRGRALDAFRKNE